ncbi:hypothetical protein GCM10020358_27900 [Amorphoplanes nipponensis]
MLDAGKGAPGAQRRASRRRWAAQTLVGRKRGAGRKGDWGRKPKGCRGWLEVETRGEGGGWGRTKGRGGWLGSNQGARGWLGSNQGARGGGWGRTKGRRGGWGRTKGEAQKVVFRAQFPGGARVGGAPWAAA